MRPLPLQAFSGLVIRNLAPSDYSAGFLGLLGELGPCMEGHRGGLGSGVKALAELRRACLAGQLTTVGEIPEEYFLKRLQEVSRVQGWACHKGGPVARVGLSQG